MRTISRAVREAEANYEHMKDVESIIPCMKNIHNTTPYNLNSDEIEEADEDCAKPQGKGFIKKYHHFTYSKPGKINCKYVRGKGAYQTHHILQLDGIHELHRLSYPSIEILLHLSHL